MWESPIHVYLFTLVNLLLFVYIISGMNMYTLNLPISEQPIDLSYYKLYLHVRRTIIDILCGRYQCYAFMYYACVYFDSNQHNDSYIYKFFTEKKREKFIHSTNQTIILWK